MKFDSIYVLHEDLSELDNGQPDEKYGVELRTEFAFTIAATYSNTPKYADKVGLVHKATGRNWWPSHLDEWRELKFYWMRNKYFVEVKVPKRRESWYSDAMDYWNDVTIPKFPKDIQATGCGFKVVNDKVTPGKLLGYFTLVRLTKKPNKLQLSLLDKFGYRKLDEGKLAEYWINGLEPGKYKQSDEVKPILENLKLFKPAHIPIEALSKDKRYLVKETH